MDYYDLCVIGGGASGLISAIEYKNNHKNSTVVILERLPKVGKKILATGNGRCNLSNIHASAKDYNYPEFAQTVFEKFDVQSNIDFFKSIGLITIVDSDGRVYPKSNAATSVLDILLIECKKLGVTILCDCTVYKLTKHENFEINEKIKAKNVIVACGGMSSSKLGSDGSGYEITRKLGHAVTPLFPALVQIKTENKYVKQLKGIRAKASLSLKENDNIISESEGEILFTDYGISGIAAMDISRFIKPSKNQQIYIDLANDMTQAEIEEYLYQIICHNPNSVASELLIGLLHKKIAQTVMKYCSVSLDEKTSNLSKKSLSAIAYSLKNFKLKVLGTQGFDFAQITSGGLSLSEFNDKTLESKLVKGLYCCGEILDIDSKCGGYNLNWAWSSGRLAGTVSGERKS